jgi:hypothetical protein
VLQRATLAEKEVSALKEQLGTPGTADNNNKTPSSSSSSSNMPAKHSSDASEGNPGHGESGNRPGPEEIAAKEKEVSTLKFKNFVSMLKKSKRL